MKKNASIALASIFMAAALSGIATASERHTKQEVTADDCVNQYIDQALTPTDEPSYNISMTYPDGYLEKLVANCEDLTKSQSDFYKGMTEYCETRGNMTIEFK